MKYLVAGLCLALLMTFSFSYAHAGRCGKVWVQGHHNRHGKWVKGHWRHLHWQPGHYNHRGMWVPGHCR